MGQGAIKFKYARKCKSSLFTVSWVIGKKKKFEKEKYNYLIYEILQLVKNFKHRFFILLPLPVTVENDDLYNLSFSSRA